jgi:hypothetical protein
MGIERSSKQRTKRRMALSRRASCRRPRAGMISHVGRFLDRVDRRRALDKAALAGSIAWSRPYPLYVKVGIAFRASLLAPGMIIFV